MSNILIILAIPFAISLILSLYITPRMKIISYNGLGILGKTNEKSHGMEMGGLSLFPIMLISMCLTSALPVVFHIEEIQQDVEPTLWRILQIIVGCAFLYIIGVKDDFHGTSTNVKFLALFLTAAMFPISGLWINNLHGLFGVYAVPAWVGMPFTLLLAIFLIQLPSVTDSPDGIATGVCTLLVALFLFLSIYGNHPLSAIIASATLGVALPFTLGKLFNKKWEKTLIGSSGNYILGYILSYLAIGMIRQCGERLPEGAIMLCIGIIFIPVLDAFRVLINRIREKRDLLKPDKNQMQHLLIRTGMAQKYVSLMTALIILSICFINLLCVYCHLEKTIIFIIDILIWIFLRLFINGRIARHEAIYTHEKWNKEYGREAWEANIPSEILNKKIEQFGTMGLPTNMLSENTEEFIPDGMSGFERGTKRIIDFLASGLCLIIFSPLFLICYILIKLDDGGPAIYKQERIGRFGRPFYIYKFRSMRTDAEEAGPALSHASGEDDPRLTKVGKFLRAHHLDELPQLWNVFNGDMALVGYRPERKFYIDQIMEYDPRYSFLYQIRPGVTSYATLHYGYTDTMEKMLRRTELDLYYLKNRSWWFDCKVLFLTFTGIIFGKKF